MSADPTRLRRSLFFVPGGDARKLEKARALAADTLLLDLEDSVAPAEKELARERVAAFLREGDFGGSEPAVRINPEGTPFYDEDLDAAVAAGAGAIMLPKAEDSAALARTAGQIRAAAEQAGRTGSVALLALVETAAGLVHAAALPAAAAEVEGLCFGHADFSRDMGLVEADASEGVVLQARCTVAIAARAGAIAPIDTVYLDVRDDEGFRRDAEQGRRLGFTGKLCIHPRQLEIANAVHTPAPEEIAYARRVVDAARAAAQEGKGVFTVDGKMVDAPLVAAQERILETAALAGLVDAEDDGR